jgi:hypothetical protein
LKIAYYVHLNLKPGSGVYKKILNQISCWLKLGHDARLFIVTRDEQIKNSLYSSNIKEKVEVVMYPNGFNPFSLLKRLKAFDEMKDKILNWSPDIVYTRQDLYYPPIVNLARKSRFIAEINTYDLAELWGYSKTQWLYSILTRNKFLSFCSGFVFVTYELSNKEAYKKFNKAYAVIPNGIKLDEFDTLLPNFSDDVNLVFLGQGSYPWYGVDKILFLAKNFPKWNFHIIGFSNTISEKDLKNVFFHNFLPREKYEEILKSADCAIGTLALHRNKMNEACPLKTREYLAFGLPVIIGYSDTDFLEGADFILTLPNDENNVNENLSAIEKFVLKWKGKRVPRDMITHLDICEKEKQRISFFQSIIGGRLK